MSCLSKRVPKYVPIAITGQIGIRALRAASTSVVLSVVGRPALAAKKVLSSARNSRHRSFAEAPGRLIGGLDDQWQAAQIYLSSEIPSGQYALAYK